MPVERSESSWLESNNVGGNGRGNWEDRAVNGDEGTSTAWSDSRGDLGGIVDIAAIAGQASLGRDLWLGSRDVVLGNVRVCLGDVGELSCGDVERFGDNIDWVVSQPIGDVKGSVRGIKVAFVKGKQVLVLVIETLDGVSLSLGEVPDVTDVEGRDLVASLIINSANQDGAIVDNAPFSLNQKL
jgi:hypothetical protein